MSLEKFNRMLNERRSELIEIVEKYKGKIQDHYYHQWRHNVHTSNYDQLEAQVFAALLTSLVDNVDDYFANFISMLNDISGVLLRISTGVPNLDNELEKNNVSNTNSDVIENKSKTNELVEKEEIVISEQINIEL